MRLSCMPHVILPGCSVKESPQAKVETKVEFAADRENWLLKYVSWHAPCRMFLVSMHDLSSAVLLTLAGYTN
jgi:hypothetical protein